MFHFVPGVPRENGTLYRRGYTNLRSASSKAAAACGWRRVRDEMIVCLCRTHVNLMFLPFNIWQKAGYDTYKRKKCAYFKNIIDAGAVCQFT
ncbi:MAG: hypothetical protein JWQ54_4243 [Mucilaginibacter sp.]|nr:hypothetical protein [Mucilaginibacter sp.]